MLSLQLAGSILPFVYYFEQQLQDKDFDKFISYATTNWNIFFDFARFMSKNYIFVIDQDDPKSKSWFLIFRC